MSWQKSRAADTLGPVRQRRSTELERRQRTGSSDRVGHGCWRTLSRAFCSRIRNPSLERTLRSVQKTMCEALIEHAARITPRCHSAAQPFRSVDSSCRFRDTFHRRSLLIKEKKSRVRLEPELEEMAADWGPLHRIEMAAKFKRWSRQLRISAAITLKDRSWPKPTPAMPRVAHRLAALN